MWVFDPPGCLFMRLPPTVMQFTLNIYCQGLILMHFVAFLGNLLAQIGTNLALHNYLGSFLVKIWVFDPLGCPFMGLPPTVMQFMLKI
jgi:hypothetical protein